MFKLLALGGDMHFATTFQLSYFFTA